MNKNTIIGFVLIGVIMFGFSWYQSKQYNEQAAAQAERDAIAMMEHMAIDSVKRATADSTVTEVAAPVVIENQALYKDSLLNVVSAANADTTTYSLVNDKLIVDFTPKGAQFNKVTVKDYMSYDSTALELIKPDKSNYGINLYAYTNEAINTSDFVFNVVEHNDSTIVMQLPFANGGYLQQKYTLEAGSYMVKNELSISGNVIPRNVSNLDIDWTLTIPRLEPGYKNEKQYSNVSYYFPSDEELEDIGRGSDGSERVNSRFKWFAFQQQFFSAIMTAPQEFASAEDLSVKFFSEEQYNESGNLMTCHAKLRSEFQSGQDVVIPYNFYFGPNDFDILQEYDEGYEEIIPLGWWIVGWISRFVIIPCFDLLGGFITNYGLIILLMTILIKLVLSPLTLKSYKSSAKMQVLKPEIDQLNKKFPNEKDAMKKQQAMMDLYRKAGVSPMGGCLPMLLQMPILFAMFRFFPACIDLRQQSFLWADDLSSYDSVWDFGFNIPLLGDHLSLFALLMAVTMFFYSKMTSSQMSNDPNMAGMKFMTLWLMPIMMFVICNNLSAALSYYYLLSNIITMIQTWYVRKFIVTEDKVRAEMVANANKPRQKSKWQLRLEEAQRMQEQMQKNRR